MKMSMTSPKVSVMVPVYNTGQFLAATIEALISQSYRDMEIVIIDDGSKDESPQILREFAARDGRIRLTIRENRGIVATRNELLAQSRGQYLAVNDADDISVTDRIEQQVAYLDSHPNVVAVGGWWDMIDAAGRFLTTFKAPTTNAEIQSALLVGHCSLTHSCVMMRRQAVEKVGGYDARFTFGHDFNMWLRLGEVGELANMPRVLARFRLHEGSVSETKRYEQREFCRRACEEAWQRRGITDGRFDASQPWRPGKDRRSRHRFALQYGWWAYGSGERRTALHYAKRAIASMPLSLDGWKLLAIAAFKPAH
jgi:glycosyltransferase involved in cell wall biosynthesis